MLRKCCAHCPGSVTRTGDPIRDHVCNAPDYVAGNLRTPSFAGKKHVCKQAAREDKRLEGVNLPEEPGDRKPTTPSSCYERFAVAKKFHAENLQHQPLPDRVDDAIFTNNKSSEERCNCDTVKRCQRIVPRRPAMKREPARATKYAPALGCKKPATYMDLAICWETPIDSSYEPRRPAHIDGSDGGPAPAVFSYVQHADSQVDVRDGAIPKRDEDYCDNCTENRERAEADEELCKNLNSIHITNQHHHQQQQQRNVGGIGEAARNKRIAFNRSVHCLACNKVNSPRRSRAKSACFLQKHGVNLKRSNGLPSVRSQVPRPRTPYARRSFCIDSLAPPFSIVSGCRDADYPEHWRLTSIYQQSYRNPKKLREGRTILNYDRIP